MLKPSCRRFREGFSPGSGEQHRRGCPSCAAYALMVETLATAGVQIPIPQPLRQRLVAIPASGDADGGPLAGLDLPQLPMPAELSSRLRAIPRRQTGDRPPAWVRRSRYAVAASYLLVVLLGAAFGNPVASAQQAGRSLGQHANRIVERAEVEGRARLEILERVTLERLRRDRQVIESAAASLAFRLRALVQRLGLEAQTVPQKYDTLPPSESTEENS